MKTYLTSMDIFFQDKDDDKITKMKELLKKDYDIERISIMKLSSIDVKFICIYTTKEVKNSIINDFHLERKLGWRNGYIY